MAALAVVYVLTVLFSAEPTPTGPASFGGQGRISELGSGLIQSLMLQRGQQESQDFRVRNSNRTMKVQQALKDNGFYAGPVDGVMRKGTLEAIQSFQRSKDLKVTGRIDDETARELQIR
jgi:peptidoglycan hydrolase-like protein with peptidoglycan-binding domain